MNNDFQYFSDRNSQKKSQNFLSESILDSVWSGIYQLKDKFSENLAKNFPDKRKTFKTSGIVDFDEELFLNDISSHKIDLNSPNGRLDYIEFIFRNLRDRCPQNDQKDDYQNMTFWAFKNDGKSSQKRFREEINLIFERNNLVYELDENGQIIKRVPEGLKDLVEDMNMLECPSDQKQKTNNAVELFYSKDSGIEKKKIACRELGDVLEKVRKSLRKTDFLKKDEPNLFDILNHYAIRHNKHTEKIIENPILWDWIFYALFNTVITFYKLQK